MDAILNILNLYTVEELNLMSNEEYVKLLNPDVTFVSNEIDDEFFYDF